MDQLKTASWVASYLGVGIQRVYELCRTDSSFPKIVFGERQYRFSKNAIDRWIADGGTPRHEAEVSDVQN